MEETQSKTALEAKFANRVGECFLGACDRLAEDRGISVDALIELLFSKDDDLDSGLCLWLGTSVETFEELVAGNLTAPDLGDRQNAA